MIALFRWCAYLQPSQVDAVHEAVVNAKEAGVVPGTSLPREHVRVSLTVRRVLAVRAADEETDIIYTQEAQEEARRKHQRLLRAISDDRA